VNGARLMMLALACSLASSCHRTPAAASGPDPTTGETEPEAPTAPQPAPLESTLASGAPRFAAPLHTTSEPEGPATEAGAVELCCDEFAAGLCFRVTDVQACDAQSSRARSCPATSVREIRDSSGRAAWVCAEPEPRP
jgi:hypothetical protein